MPDEKQVQWVTRVLGSGPGTETESDGTPLQSAIAQFRAASAAVDAQITALQHALTASDDEELREIGDYGLNAVTGNFRVPLMAALLDIERGADPGQKLASAIEAFRDHLETDDQVEACDDNPFGVAVSIRATLIPALDQLARGIAS
jgi:hypothetical protein